MATINPYESPKTASSAVEVAGNRWSLLVLLPTGMVASSVLGAVTNMINGAVSPEYFSIVMGWSRHGNIWARSVFQGALEGLAYGLAFSFIFMMTAAIASRLKCDYRHAVAYIPLACGGVLITWTIGGVIGLTWAATNPPLYRSVFPVVPYVGVERFGWVGGSIWGAIYGGLIVVGLASALFVIRWKRQIRVGDDCAGGARHGPRAESPPA